MLVGILITFYDTYKASIPRLASLVLLERVWRFLHCLDESRGFHSRVQILLYTFGLLNQLLCLLWPERSSGRRGVTFALHAS